MNNCTENDNTSFSSEYPGGFGLLPDLLGLAVILVRCWTVVFSFSAIFVNCVVFAATSRASQDTLPSKVLIQNSILTHILWAVQACSPALSYILKAYNALGIRAFVNSINSHIGPTIMYSQLLSALLLAFDRLYAVLRPLTYRTMGYSTLAKALLIASAWAGAAALALPGVIIPFVRHDLDNRSFVLKLNYGFKHFTSGSRQYITISINVLIFVLYLTIFLVLDLQRRCNRALAMSTSHNRRTTLSLTLTYFVIHITSVFFYLSGPVFKQVRSSIPNSVMSNDAKSVLNRTFVNIYILNSVVNSVILVSRIRVIRQYLYAVIKPRRSRDNRKSLDLQQTQPTERTKL